MMKTVCQVLVLIVFISVERAYCGSKDDSNKYMDAVLNGYLKPALRPFDPRAMPNFNTTFRTTFFVSANYSRGIMTGMTNVQRWGDCRAPYWSYGNATLNCTLTFPSLDLTYDLRGQYGSFPVVTGAVAHGRMQSTDIFVEVTTSQQRNLPYLRQFAVRSLGRFTPSFDHLSTLKAAESSLGSSFVAHSSPFAAGVLQSDFLYKLAESVSKLTMPMP